MTAATKPSRIRRARQSGAELGRARILELLGDWEPHGVEWLADESGLSAATLWQRLRELRRAGLVDVRVQDVGCALACLRAL